MEKETFEHVWEAFSILLAFASLAVLLFMPLFFISLAFTYLKQV